MNKKHLLAATVLFGVPFLLSSTAYAEEAVDNATPTSEQSDAVANDIDTPTNDEKTETEKPTEEVDSQTIEESTDSEVETDKNTQSEEAEEITSETSSPVQAGYSGFRNAEQGVTRERAMEWAYGKKAHYEQNPLYWGGDRSMPYGMDVDGYHGSQCVDWIRGYAKDLWQQDVFNFGRSAFEIWQMTTGGNRLPEGWERIENYNEFTPQPGDIAFFTSENNVPDFRHSDGHTGIITSATNTTYNSIDQNVTTTKFKSNGTYGTPPVERVNQPYFSQYYGNFLGVIRPKFVTAHVPVITTKEETRTEVIPKPETIRIEDASLDKGKENLVAGNEGTKEIVERITLTDGNETGREKLSERVTLEAKADTLYVGTKEATPAEQKIQFDVKAGSVNVNITTAPNYSVELTYLGNTFPKQQVNAQGKITAGAQVGILHEGDVIQYRLYDTAGTKVDEGSYTVQGHDHYAAAPVLDSVKVGDTIISGTAAPNSRVEISYRTDGRKTNQLGTAFGGSVMSDANGRFEFALSQAKLRTAGLPTPAPGTLSTGTLVSVWVDDSGYQGRIASTFLTGATTPTPDNKPTDPAQPNKPDGAGNSTGGATDNTTGGTTDNTAGSTETKGSTSESTASAKTSSTATTTTNSSDKQLPSTGETDAFTIFAPAALMILTGLGLVAKKKEQ